MFMPDRHKKDIECITKEKIDDKCPDRLEEEPKENFKK